MAVIAGDICFAFANELIAKSSFSKRTEVIAYFNHIVHLVVYGELLDILSSFRNVSSHDIEKIHYLKTASYSFEAPLKIGAMLAGASEAQLRPLESYAVPLGKAFQLQDDILGLFGNENRLGKPVGSDLREGKKTLLIVHAIGNARSADAEFLRRCLGKKNISPAEIRKARQIVIKTKSLKYSQELIKELILKAKSAISHASIRQEAKSFLLALADFVGEREF
jgi:geranylgeranyl diphosphate synthase type I